jgi:hypothetical protein
MKKKKYKARPFVSRQNNIKFNINLDNVRFSKFKRKILILLTAANRQEQTKNCRLNPLPREKLSKSSRKNLQVKIRNLHGLKNANAD